MEMTTVMRIIGLKIMGCIAEANHIAEVCRTQPGCVQHLCHTRPRALFYVTIEVAGMRAVWATSPSSKITCS